MLDVNWVKLRMACPIDISHITSLASEVDNSLSYKLCDKPELIDDARSKIDILIKRLLSMFHTKKMMSDKDSSKVFGKLQEDFGRIIGILDEFLDESIKGRTVIKIKEDKSYRFYISQLKELLYGDIYDVLLKATVETNKKFEDVEKDENGVSKEQFFFYKVYELVSVNVGVFGSLARKGEKGKTFASFDSSLPFHAEDMGGQRMKDDRTIVVQDVAVEAANDASLINDLRNVLSGV